MQAKLDLRLRQLHQAMGQVCTADLSSIQPVAFSGPRGSYCAVDFSQGKSDAELANALSLFIANIACLKDHLKAWCDRNNKAFPGDTLINSNTDVAVIHDLWNRDKHCDLTTSRSKLWPELREIQQVGRLSTSSTAAAWSALTIDPRTGRLKKHGTGAVELVIDAVVVDKHGNRVDSLLSIAQRAISAWEVVLAAAGVKLPSR